MSEKSAAKLIAEHEAEVEKLKAKQAEELHKATFAEYPKAIQVPAVPPVDPGVETVTIIVNSPEEEKAAKAGKSKNPASPTSGEDRKAVVAKEKEEKAKKGGRR